MSEGEKDNLSKDEIAARFAIPERQVKVNKLLQKMDGEEVYCICKSADISRFMIGCDKCNEWYHGDCIGMTAEESNFIKSYYCKICRKKDPSLKIKYKKKKTEHSSSSSSSKKPDKYDKHDKHGKHSHHDKKHSHKDRDRDRDRDRERDKHKRQKEKHRDKSRHDKHDRHDRHDKHRKKDKHRDKEKKKSSHSSLSTLSALAVEDDLSETKSEVNVDSPPESPCVTPVPGSPVHTAPAPTPAWKPDAPTSVAGPHQLDPRKFLDQAPPPPPSSAQLKQKLEKAQKAPDKYDKYRMDKPVKAEKPSAPPEKPREVKPEKEQKLREEKVEEVKKPVKTAKQCGQCAACNRNEDCGVCDNCIARRVGSSGKSTQKCRLRQCTNYTRRPVPAEWDDLPTDDVDIPPNPADFENLLAKPKTPTGKRGRPRKDTTVETTPKRKYKKRKPETVATPPKRKYKKRRQESSESEESEGEDLKQCFGPGCVEPARAGSKYCSDKCGLKLATDRIFEILPSRLLQWKAKPCVSEIKNKEQLEKIRQQQEQLRKQLVQLDKKHREIDMVIERAKKATVASEEEDNEEDDSEMTIYCVTCGHQINQKTAVRHMEKCFAKLESLSSFGSIYKTRIEGNSMFCDYYSPQSGTYCKRLKVLCPEHTREPKVGADEVCGCPLVKDLFTMTGEFCRLPKRKCNKHFIWEKLRRAAIDQERLSQWMRLDDLFEQERNIKMSMAERAGVLSLVLHQTIDHDPHSVLIVPPTRDTTDLIGSFSM